jgi:hypothetical protein
MVHRADPKFSTDLLECVSVVDLMTYGRGTASLAADGFQLRTPQEQMQRVLATATAHISVPTA